MPQGLNIFLKTLSRDSFNQICIVTSFKKKIWFTAHLFYSKNRPIKFCVLLLTRYLKKFQTKKISNFCYHAYYNQQQSYLSIKLC